MITITEALQELKTISQRVSKKQEAIASYVARDSRIVDPLVKHGGSEKFITEERQSINDLRNRMIGIRSSIQSANLSNQLTIAGVTRSVADWLTWRREIATGEQTFISLLLSNIRRVRDNSQTKAVRSAMEVTEPVNVTVNLDEQKLVKEGEQVETCLSELDGKLSLFNAVTTINV